MDVSKDCFADNQHIFYPVYIILNKCIKTTTIDTIKNSL